MPTITDPDKRLRDLLDKQDGPIARAFLEAIANARGQIDVDELATLIEQGRLSEAFDALNNLADPLAAAVNNTLVMAGQSTASFLSTHAVTSIAFDMVNVRAVQAMQQNRLTLIREFDDEQRRATQAAINGGLQRGANPREIARDFRDSVGLTERQWGAVANYRASLERVGQDGETAQAAALDRALRDKRTDRTVRSAIANMKPLPQAKIDMMVQRYTERYVKYRAEVIGRTEALRAVHQGAEEMYRQLIDAGDLDEADITRKWVTVLDGRERLTHEILHGQVRGFGEAWQTINGVIRYPGDPAASGTETIACRCCLAVSIAT